MQVVGFDFGMKFIGVSVGNISLSSIQSLPSVSAKNGEPNWKQMDNVYQRWQPNYFVVGIPVHMDGREQWITHQARAFKKKLKLHYAIEVFEVDERLSTDDAKRRLANDPLYAKRLPTKNDLDGMSARIILEQFFFEQRREHAESV
jgi:putative holliday junction resolvase